MGKRGLYISNKVKVLLCSLFNGLLINCLPLDSICVCRPGLCMVGTSLLRIYGMVTTSSAYADSNAYCVFLSMVSVRL